MNLSLMYFVVAGLFILSFLLFIIVFIILIVAVVLGFIPIGWEVVIEHFLLLLTFFQVGGWVGVTVLIAPPEVIECSCTSQVRT